MFSSWAIPIISLYQLHFYSSLLKNWMTNIRSNVLQNTIAELCHLWIFCKSKIRRRKTTRSLVFPIKNGKLREIFQYFPGYYTIQILHKGRVRVAICFRINPICFLIFSWSVMRQWAGIVYVTCVWQNLGLVDNYFDYSEESNQWL